MYDVFNRSYYIVEDSELISVNVQGRIGSFEVWSVGSENSGVQ